MPSEGDLTTVISRLATEEGLEASDISSALGLDESLVKLVLSSDTRAAKQRALDVDPERAYEVVTDSEFDTIKSAYHDLMLRDPNVPAGVKERGLRWLMDEKKGRNATKNAPPGISVNILRLNERLTGLNSRREKLLGAVVEAATKPA